MWILVNDVRRGHVCLVCVCVCLFLLLLPLLYYILDWFDRLMIAIRGARSIEPPRVLLCVYYTTANGMTVICAICRRELRQRVCVLSVLKVEVICYGYICCVRERICVCVCVCERSDLHHIAQISFDRCPHHNTHHNDKRNECEEREKQIIQALRDTGTAIDFHCFLENPHYNL